MRVFKKCSKFEHICLHPKKIVFRKSLRGHLSNVTTDQSKNFIFELKIFHINDIIHCRSEFSPRVPCGVAYKKKSENNTSLKSDNASGPDSLLTLNGGTS